MGIELCTPRLLPAHLAPLVAAFSAAPPAAPRRNLNAQFSASADALDLVTLLLEFNPAKRMTAEGALKHPYLAQFHTGEEPTAPRAVSISIDDNVKYTVQDYRDKLYKEVVAKKRANRKFYAQ
jgi:mitogen-activated protein kinase 15